MRSKFVRLLGQLKIQNRDTTSQLSVGASNSYVLTIVSSDKWDIGVTFYLTLNFLVSCITYLFALPVSGINSRHLTKQVVRLT